ncbi:MAG: hypothetical protein QOE56_2736, partial [Solirubrobacterales bacterium]|nr:hypothetical protein [Solirubrobacterales bacterium]
TTVLDDSLVNSLRHRTEQLQGVNSTLRDQLDKAEQALSAHEGFATDVQPFLLADQLANQEVVIVTTDGADAGALDEAAHALNLAGARIVTTITVQPAMTSGTDADAQQLAGILGQPANTTPDELMADAADALAARLSETPARTVDVNDDLLGELLSAGMVVAPGLSDADLAGVGGPGQVVVVVDGGTGTSASTAGEVLLAPLVAALVDRQQPTAAGEGSDRTSTFLSTARDLAGSGDLVSVDGLDQSVGGSALVLGIERWLLTGQGGAFGLGDQASQPLPDPPA